MFDEFDQRMLSRIDAILANAKPGSELQAKAEQYNRGRSRENGPLWGEKAALARAWAETPAQERDRITYGWNNARSIPSASDFIGRMRGQAIIPALLIAAGEGDVEIEANFVSDDGGTAPVRVTIREATDPLTAIEAVRQILAALELHLEAAVRLDNYEFISVRPEAVNVSAQPALKAIEAVDAAMTRMRAALGAAKLPRFPEATEAAVRRIVADFQGKKGNRRSAGSGVSTLGGKGRGKAKAAK